MQPARIAALLEPYLAQANDQRLTAANLENISTYIDLLQRWNARINLTAIRSEEEIVTRHFGESFFAASHLFPRAVEDRPAEQSTPVQAAERRKKLSPTLGDVGSGAGFPGIPIKLWAPEISLTLIESNQKKATFLKEVARALTLTNINIQTTRAESLSPATFDVVTLRAVERFETILPVAAGLVAPGGRVALLIGSPQLAAAQDTLSAWKWQQPQPIPGSQSRVLAIGSPSEPI